MAGRILLTGVGPVSCCGTGEAEFHDSLAAGRDGISSLTFPWDTGSRENRAGVVRDFDVAKWLADAPPMGRASQLAHVAVQLAIRHAGLGDAPYSADRIALVVGTAMGDVVEFEEDWPATVQPDGGGAEPADAARGAMRFGNIAERLATYFGLEGRAHVVASACAAGNHAIATGAEWLRQGVADAVVVVAADTIAYGGMLGFNRLLLQAPTACQPFDLNRRGTILAEGAGAMILEREDGARRRGAPVICEVAGWGLSCDGGGAFVSRLNDLRGMRLAYERAMRVAGVGPQDVDHVSAHGSGTRLNDQKETLFLKDVLGERARNIPVNAIKSMLGHSQGAAAMLEGIASALSISRDVVYPTINYRTPDPDCDLDCVPNEARAHRVNVVLSSSYGIGGTNATVIFRRLGSA